MKPEKNSMLNESQKPDKVCRICQDKDNKEPLYSPCLCHSYVHQSCLIDWLRAKQGVQAGGTVLYEAQCEICLTEINFKRNYNESEARVGFIAVLKTIMKTVWHYLKYTKYLFLFCNVLWLLFNTFAVRKYYLFGILPSWSLEYVYDKSFFFLGDLTIILQIGVFVLLVLPSVWFSTSGKKIANHYMGRPIDQDVPSPFSISLLKLNICMFFLAPLIATLLLIVFGVIPMQTTTKVFRLQDYSNTSTHILGSLLYCLVVSMLPVEKLAHLKSSSFVLLFYTKYYAKSVTVLYLRLLFSIVIMKPILEFFFANALFGKNNETISLKHMSFETIFTSPYRSVIVFTIAIMQFCNQTLFRNGSFHFAPATNEYHRPSRKIFTYSMFSLAVQTLRDIFHMVGAFTLTIGAALTVVVAYRPDIASMSLGIIIPDMQEKSFLFTLYQPQVALVWTNIDKVFVVLGPLVSNFSQWYFKPFALAFARYFRLSSYLFGENKVDERGHVVYRNWKQKFFGSHAAQLSNPDLYTKPQLKTEIPGLLQSCPTVDAYFVPDGRYARVPNYAETSPAKRYFVTVSRNDQVLDSKPIDITLANAELIDLPAYSYDVVYMPPCFKARIFCFYFSMGVVANITSLYVLFSSNYIGSKALNLAAKIPRLEPLIDTDTYFTYANVCLGAASQLFLFNTFKDRIIAIHEMKMITSVVETLIFSFALALYTLAIVTFFSKGMSFYVAMVYDIVFKKLINHENIDTDSSKSFFGFPNYLLSKHSTIFMVPIGIYFGISMTLVIIVIGADGSMKQIASAAWKCFMRPPLKFFLRYFLTPIGSQLFLIFLLKFKLISSIQDFKQQVFVQFSGLVGTWDCYALLLLGPTLFLVFAFNDLTSILKNYWNKKRKNTMESLNEDKVVLQNVIGTVDK